MYGSTVGSNPTPSAKKTFSMLMFQHFSTQHSEKSMFSFMHLYIQEALWKSLYVLLSVFLCFCVCLHFFDVFLFHHAYVFFTTTHTETFMTLDVTEAFSTMLLLCLYVSCVCVCPLCVYTFLTFVNPSCFRLEAKVLLGLSILSAVLFIASYQLALYVICPFVWNFFLPNESTQTWQYAPRLAPYVFLLVRVLCTVHVVCQLPCIACLVHVFFHFPIHTLARSRKIHHVVLLLVSAFVCPPDVFTQLLCWFCLVCMHESILFFVYITHAYSAALVSLRISEMNMSV